MKSFTDEFLQKCNTDDKATKELKGVKNYACTEWNNSYNNSNNNNHDNNSYHKNVYEETLKHDAKVETKNTTHNVMQFLFI